MVDELSLIEEILDGNTSAFDYFVQTYQDMAFTVAYRICNNQHDAEDITQESFIKAYQNLRDFRCNSKFSSWLYKIVYNTAISFVKRNNRQTENLSKDIENKGIEPEKYLFRNEQEKLVNTILEQMPNTEALLLTLYYLEDTSIKDIADITSLKVSNVKVKLFRARKNFKKLLFKNNFNIDDL
ncbi:MAG: RNA polymerase sigma factor [Bacteroidales bacterium]|jgi:RNA polymerase sigma factor (sigma-70 family)